MQNVPYHTFIYYRLPEDIASGSKHVEDITQKEEYKTQHTAKIWNQEVLRYLSHL
jgi:hypothetical protein